MKFSAGVFVFPSHNFLTHNCYTCLELNAHSLVLSLLYLKESNKEHWFVPTHYNSQPCEHFYRQIRSFSTVFSTVTNCSTKEAISRVKKIQLQSDISISNTVFKFPRFLDLNGSSETNSFALPTQEKMIEIIEDCQKRAINDATNIGLLKEPVLEIPCDIIPYRGRSNMKNIKKNGISDQSHKVSIDDIKFKNFANKLNGKKVEETGPYVEIFRRNRRFVVLKTYLCHLLSKEYNKLSSDRLLRVKNAYANVTKTTNPEPKKITTKQKITRKYKKKRVQRKY